MACMDKAIAASIAKPPRRFSADVTQDDVTGKQQVARASSSPSSVDVIILPLSPSQADDVVISEILTADSRLPFSNPEETNLSANGPKPIPWRKSSAVLDEDELELWKQSHRDVLQRLVNLTDRYSDLEAKHKDLDIKYHQLVRYVNCKSHLSNNLVEHFGTENTDNTSHASDKAVYSVSFHDSSDPTYSTTVDEYGFLVQHRDEEPDNILPPNIRADLACDLRNTSVFYSTKTESINLAVVENESSSSEKLHKRQISALKPSDLMGISADAHRVKFEKLLASRRSMPPDQFHNQLKHLMRYGAPTPELRTKAWQYCIHYQLYRRRCNEYVLSNSKQYYQTLLDSRSRTLASSSSTPLTFGNTLEMSAAKQIGLDLLRTFPNNIYFKDSASPVIERLENVLTAFSKHNAQIGYTQGMNRLAGIALLCLPDEVDAFWALVTITEHLLPGYYGDTMRELLIDQRVLAELVAEKLPRLAVHLKAQYIDINLFSFNWFLVIFVDSTLPYVFMPLWDAFMLEGKKVLFRYALAMLKYWERDLLALDSCSALNNFLRSTGERVNTPAAAARLRRIAFGEMNPLAGRMIERKRRAHRTAVEIELASIQRARSEIRNASAAAAAVEVGTETLNLLNVQRVEREQQQSRNTTTDEDDDFAEPSRLLTTDLDSVNSLYFAADAAVNRSDDDDDDDSWHSVQSSYNYDNFDDSAGSPYCRRGRGNESNSQVGIRVGSTSVVEDYAGDRFCESAPDLSSPVELPGEQKDAKDSTLRRSASYHNMDGVALEKFMPAPNERPKSAEPNFDISQTDANAVFDSVQHTAQSSEREYFSTRCPSQISASRSDSTATGPTPIPPPRKIRQRQLSAGSPTRFTRLLSRATAIRSSFGGTAATKKAMLNRAISNAASRHGEFLKRKMGPKQPILTQATADNSLTNSDEVLHMDKKCEHYNKPMLLSHDVKEPGLSTFYYKMLRKCHCAMDLDTERQNKNSVSAGEIMSTSNEAEANSVFFHPGFKNYAVDNNDNDDIDNVSHALPDTDNITAADATPTRRRSSFAITLRTAVTQRLGQLIPAANNGPPYVISEPQQDDFGNWRGKIIGESNAGTAAYRTTPEATGALVAVQEFTEVSISTTKQSYTSSQAGKNWADRNGQKVGDSSRFILKLPQHEPFSYGESLPSMKPINF